MTQLRKVLTILFIIVMIAVVFKAVGGFIWNTMDTTKWPIEDKKFFGMAYIIIASIGIGIYLTESKEYHL